MREGKFIYSHNTTNWTPLQLLTKLDDFQTALTSNTNSLDIVANLPSDMLPPIRQDMRRQTIERTTNPNRDDPIHKYKEESYNKNMNRFKEVKTTQNIQMASLEKMFDSFINGKTNVKKKVVSPMKKTKFDIKEEAMRRLREDMKDNKSVTSKKSKQSKR